MNGKVLAAMIREQGLEYVVEDMHSDGLALAQGIILSALDAQEAARSASAPSMEELREKIGQAAYEWQQYVDTDHAPINLVSFMEQQFDAALSATTPRQDA